LVSSLVRAFAASPAFAPALERAVVALLEASGGLTLAGVLGMEGTGAAERVAAGSWTP
jgi:hypothetical protein